MQLYERVVLSLAAAALLSFGTVADSFAQGQALDGIIEGLVRTQSENTPVPGATVRAFNAGTGYERSVVSDESGRYGLPLLPPGEYVVPSQCSSATTSAALRAGPW